MQYTTDGNSIFKFYETPCNCILIVRNTAYYILHFDQLVFAFIKIILVFASGF